MVEKFRHVRNLTNEDGTSKAWIIAQEDRYYNLLKFSNKFGFDVSINDPSSQIFSNKLSILEDVNSIKSVIEFLLKLSIRNLDKNPIFNEIKQNFIPNLISDLNSDCFLSNITINNLQNYYPEFFSVLMDRETFYYYNNTYSNFKIQKSKIDTLKDNSVFFLSAISKLEKSYSELQKELFSIIQFYNLLSISYLPVIFYIEKALNDFENLFNSVFLNISASDFQIETQEVIEVHFPLANYSFPNISFENFQSEFTNNQSINLLEYIALDHS